MKPLISIITISKDDAQGLANTLASAAMQSFRDYEHIVIRSGSSMLVEIPTDPRLVVLDEPALGISHALNTGVQVARAEWVQFLNGGDSFASTHSLQELVARTDRMVPLVCSFAQVLEHSFTIPRRELRPGRDPFIYISHQATLFRRDLFDRYGLFDPGIKIHMDLDWLTRLPHDLPFVFIDDVTIRFDPYGVSATNVVYSSIEEAGILWRTPRYRGRVIAVLGLLLPFRIIRRAWRRLT